MTKVETGEFSNIIEHNPNKRRKNDMIVIKDFNCCLHVPLHLSELYWSSDCGLVLNAFLVVLVAVVSGLKLMNVYVFMISIMC